MAEKLKRGQLSRSAILDAAMIVAREGGVDFTMRALGRELNAWPAAIYDHFPTKLDLQYALLDLIIGEALADEAVGRLLDQSGDWGERLKAFSLDIFDGLSAYRGVGRLITHHGAAGPSNVVRLVQLCLDHLMARGLSLDRASVIFQVLAFFVAEMADLAAAARDGLVTEEVPENAMSPEGRGGGFEYFMRTTIAIPVRDRLAAGLDLFIMAVIAETSTE